MKSNEENRIEALDELLAEVDHHVKWCEQQEPGSAAKSLRSLHLNAHGWLTSLQLGISLDQLQNGGAKEGGDL